MTKMKELAVKNKELEAVSRKRDKELNQLKEELLTYNEKTQNLNEEAGYQKDINKILIKKVRDIEKLNETLELTLAKKKDDRKEAVIVSKPTKVGKEQDLIQLRNTTNRSTAEAETEVQRRIENKQGKVNKVCTKYAYGQECKYGETCKFIHKRICKIWAM